VTAEPTSGKDDFQTPAEIACPPLLRHICPEWRLWEPAQGKGNIVRYFRAQGYEMHGSDIKTGHDFLTDEPPCEFDCIITNPPYSGKNVYDWLSKCYRIGKPFALLIPIKSFDSYRRQKLFHEYGLEVILLPRRVAFETPTGKTGRDSNPNLMTAWFTFGLDIGQQITFTGMAEEEKPQLRLELAG